MSRLREEQQDPMPAPQAPRHARASRSPLTGVGAMLVLAARRDRIRLSVWVGVLTFMLLYTPFALKLAYPTAAERASRVELMKTPAGIMLAGPMFGKNETDLGVMIANELTLSLMVAASIMAILTVIRHTRAEEESGAAELVMSSVVARPARTVAALALVGIVNAVLFVTLTLATAASGLDVLDSAAMALGITGVSMVFGAVAAVSAQLWRQARTASGAAMAALATAVVVRGVGDVVNHSGSALSWLSPIAWAQQMRPFVELRWWPLGLLALAATVCISAAFALEGRRQYDAGTLRSRGDRRNAPRVRGVLGLHLTLQRGQLISWAIALFLSGLTFGSMATALKDAARSNELLARVMATQGVNGTYTVMTQFLAAATSAFVVAGVLRLAADEQSGLAELVLAGSVSRPRWLVSAVLATLGGTAVLLGCAGLGNGLGTALATKEFRNIALLTGAGLAHLPAMAVMAGFAAVAVAVRRSWIGWTAVTFVVASLYLGALLRLPQWLLDASPVLRTTTPSRFPALTLAVLTVLAVVLSAGAAVIYRRRDAV